MKYSELIFSNKLSESHRNKIRKLESKATASNSRLVKMEKEKYVKAVTGVPEFDQAINELSEITKDKGNNKNKSVVATLQNKVELGKLNYEDICKINSLCDDTFKLLFKVEPVLEKVRPTVWFGAALTLAAIFLRFSYENGGSTTLMAFLTIINLIAIAYTLFCWHKRTVDCVDGWLNENDLNQIYKRKICREVERKLNWLVIILSIFVLVFLTFTWITNSLSFGNDIVSIVSLAMSILEPYIVSMLAQHYEWNIYHNGN